jgi:hypothetical protein
VTIGATRPRGGGGGLANRFFITFCDCQS